MCDAIHSPWSKDVLCSSTYASCVNNNCICHDGFTNDFTMLRFRDCRLPALFFPAVDGILIVLNFLSITYSLFHVKQSKMLARKIIISASIGGMIYILMNAIRFHDNHQMTGLTISLFLIALGFEFACTYMSIYSLAVPLCQLSRTPVEKISHMILCCFITFRIMLFICGTTVAVLAGNPNEINNDKTWNIIISLGAGIIALEMLGMFLGVIYHGFHMVNTIEQLSKNTPMSVNGSSIKHYLIRVRSYLKTQIYIIPIVILMVLMLPLLYYSTEYLPYTFVLYTGSQFVNPLFVLMQTKFAVSRKKGFDEYTSTSNISSSKINAGSPL